MSSSSSSVSVSTARAYCFQDPQPTSLSQSLAKKPLTIDVSKILGRGSFATVHPAEYPETGSPLAVKLFKWIKPLKFRQNVAHQELNMLLFLKQAPHTVQLRGVVKDGDSFGLALRRCKGKTLCQISRDEWRSKEWQLSVAKIFDIAKQVLESLVYFKFQNVVYGDIQEENCFLDPETGEVTIIDLGSATVLGSRAKITGCLDNRPPETQFFGTYGFGNDIWGLGMMLFSLYAGESLFPPGKLPQSIQFAQQFGGPFLKEIPAVFSGKNEEEGLAAVEKEIEDFVKSQPDNLKCHTVPWRTQIRETAKIKKEPDQAEQLIAFLEKIFVEKSSRVEAEGALKFLCDQEISTPTK